MCLQVCVCGEWTIRDSCSLGTDAFHGSVGLFKCHHHYSCVSDCMGDSDAGNEARGGIVGTEWSTVEGESEMNSCVPFGPHSCYSPFYLSH